VVETPDAGHKSERLARFDIQVAELAVRQHGVLALRQVRTLGVGPRAVQQRVTTGRLFRVHHGVYALVPRRLLSREGRWLAAVLACGEGAALSHRSAAHLHELRATSRSGIDVIVAGRIARRHAGIDAHRSLTLNAAADVTTVRGIPVTTVARTMLDLAAVVDQRAVELVIGEADLRHVFDWRAVNDQFERNLRHPGAARLRAALAPDRAGLTDSDLEELFVSIWWPTGLPRPLTRFHIDPGDGGLLIRADFAWPEAKFDLELDGSGYHAGDRRRQRDYRRDQRLKHAAWDVLRVGDEQLNDEPDTVVPTVWGVLERRLPPDLRRKWP
jgi:Transcriptional regulator, AbiEi antitoxin/Protein of unknown function (DUF559)